MARLGSLWRRLTNWLTAPKIAVILFVIGLLIVAVGATYHHCACQFSYNFVAGWEQEFEGLYANFATTLLGIAIAVFTIERANERRAEQQLRAQLIREMGSSDNGFALRAVRELRAHGSEDDNWLTDGSLKRAYLIRADLHEAGLSHANLQGAMLQEANLQAAFLLGANLQDAYLIEADLQEANLEVTNLQDANLSGAKLQKARLGKANLQNASLFRANLQDAEVDHADLREANLQEADLQGAYLYQVKLHGAKLLGTDLRGASLMEADLQGALELTDLQLVTASCLLHATMQDGRHYDGRFNLSGDTEIVKSQVEDDEAMARWYGVPLELYRDGQKWAQKNLAILRREARLEWGGATLTNSSSHTPVVLAKGLLSFVVRKLTEVFWPFGR